MEKSRKRKIANRIVTVLMILAVPVIILLGFGIRYGSDPRAKILLSVVHFTEQSLKSPEYILNGIDIMELCRDYANADTSIVGKVGMIETQKSKSSIFVDVEAYRSFDQKRANCKSEMKLLWLDAGEIDLYAEKETVFLVAPMLGEDFGYGFDTGVDLFFKAPDMSHDIDKQWFGQNATEIFELTNQMSIVETDRMIEDTNGMRSYEYVLTIPKGCGNFIWELFGMEPPETDVVTSMFISQDNRIRRMEVDLSETMEGATLILDGYNLNKMYFYQDLPDDERFELVMWRNADYKRRTEINATYYTNLGKIYTLDANMTWTVLEKGFTLKVNDVVACENGKVIAEGYFKGDICPTEPLSDVFESQDAYLYSLERLQWKEIRRDSEGFINEIMEKTSLDAVLENLNNGKK